MTRTNWQPPRHFAESSEEAREIDAYHRGQRDALDAVLVLLQREFEGVKPIKPKTGHPAERSAYGAIYSSRRVTLHGLLGRVRHLRETTNINQAIKRLIGHGARP